MKGNKKQSCGDAIRNCFTGKTGPLSYYYLFNNVKTQGTWKETTIWRNLMCSVVNLIPARYEWSNSHRFLFLRPDGQYEMFIVSIHPQPIEKTNDVIFNIRGE